MAPIHNRREAMAREQFTRGSHNTVDKSTTETLDSSSTESPDQSTLPSPPSFRSEDMHDDNQHTTDDHRPSHASRDFEDDASADKSIIFSPPSFQSDDMNPDNPDSSHGVHYDDYSTGTNDYPTIPGQALAEPLWEDECLALCTHKQ